MTELEPYRVQGDIVTAQDIRQDLRERTTDSWTSVVADVALLAANIAPTDFVPKGLRGNPAAVTGAIMFGREVGFPPMTALQSLHNIEGRVSISAEGQRALVMQAGHEIITVESTSAKCVMKGRRKSSTEWTTTTWTLDDARKAGLTNKQNWQKYPKAMLVARASADLCRLAFPDVLRGLMAVEELEDVVAITGTDTTTGETTESNTVQRKPRKKAEPKPKAESPEAELPEDEDTTETAAEPDEGKPGAGEAPADATDSAAPELDEPEPPATAEQLKRARALFEQLSYSTADRAGLANQVAGRKVKALKDLTVAEARELLATLEQVIEDLRPQSGEEAVERETSDASSPSSPEVEPTPSAPQDDPDGAAGAAAGSGGSDDGPPVSEPPSADEDGAYPAEVIDDEAEAEPRITMDQRPLVMKLLGDVGVKDKAERLSVLSDLTGREIGSTNELSKSEASSVIDSLQRCDNRDDLESVIQQTVANREGRS